MNLQYSKTFSVMLEEPGERIIGPMEPYQGFGQKRGFP